MGGGEYPDHPISSGNITGRTQVNCCDYSSSTSSCSSNSIPIPTHHTKSINMPRLDDVQELDEFEGETSRVDERKKNSSHPELINFHEKNSQRISNVALLKDAILRYKPGNLIEEVGNMLPSDYDVPKTTTLLLVGPRGSGKSSLINRISRAFEDELPDRAQVSYNLSVTDGTCFLHEYMIPRRSTSFCLYDTRSLSENSSENYDILKRWMTKGVRHGEMVLRKSDSSTEKQKIKAKITDSGFALPVKRRVDFVIFVVDGVSILKSLSGTNNQYIDTLVKTFNYPFMSFRDNKPAVVITHGDQLSSSERDEVRKQLADILGVPPTKQIFDIPDTSNPATELAVVDMLRYSLEQADRNLPSKKTFSVMVDGMLQRVDELELQGLSVMCLIMFVIVFYIAAQIDLLI